MSKGLLMILGLLVLIMGFLPILSEWGYMPVALNFIPVTGMIYNIVIMVLGALVIWFAKKSY